MGPPSLLPKKMKSPQKLKKTQPQLNQKPVQVKHATQPSQIVDALINSDAKLRLLVSMFQTHASHKTLAISKLLESRSLSAMPPDSPPVSLPPSPLLQPSETFDDQIIIKS